MTDEQKQQIGEIIFKKHNGFFAPITIAKYVGYTEKDWLDLLAAEKINFNAKITAQITELESSKIK